MKKEKDVELTKNLDLCVSCEICQSICPQNAINMHFENGQFLPKIERIKCINCSLCYEICPGIHISNPTNVDTEKLSGEFIDCYIAHSNNEKIRKISTSGGIITNLIIELIKNGRFDYAFVLDFDIFNNNSAKLNSVNNVEKIINASKSKYIPASVKNIIETLKKRHEKRYIIVGTSCQIYGIKKFLEKFNISEKNLLFLGLFCDRTLNFNFLKYMEDKFKKDNEKLIKFDYRNKENKWPGDCKLYFDSGRNILVSRKERIRLKKFFQLSRCLFCLDKLNNLADISFGDCYIDKKTSDKGRSVLIIRTNKGKEIFEKINYLFEFEKTDIKKISNSQELTRKRENIEFIKCLFNKNKIFNIKIDRVNKIYKSKLKKIKSNIKLGQKYKKNKIRTNLFLNKVRANFLFSYFRIFLNIFFSKEKNFPKKNIIIIGAGFSNKGAQSMVFTTVSKLKKKYPKKDIYLFSNQVYERSDEEKSKYNFKIMPFTNNTKIKLLKSNKKNYKKIDNETKKILKEAAFIVDISGFALSSKMSFYDNYAYLLNIVVAKKFSIPINMLPQSVGPFNYNFDFKKRFFLFFLIRFFLKYPKKIYIRESKGIFEIKRFVNKNVSKSYDIVLLDKGRDLSNIFTDDFLRKKIDIRKKSVCIIPNKKILLKNKIDEIYKIYITLIEFLLDCNFKVYILAHSSQDVEICKNIKSYFIDCENVFLIDEKLNAIELEEIIVKFNFIIASRYHSIIHAYKNGVPAVVIGWADKYEELLKNFDQFEYHIDCNSLDKQKELKYKVEKMINNFSYEKHKIKKKLDSISKSDIFDEL